MVLKNSKVVAITGVSGIGLSVAKQLRSRGALLSLADVNQASLDEAFRQLGSSPDHVMISLVDVGDPVAVNAWIDSTVTKFGRLDGAANMAGVIGKYHGIHTIMEQDDAQWDLIMRVNLTGMMYCLRAELRNMSAGGSIVNATSIQGTMGFAKHAAYSASKHGVIGLTRSAAKEVANIRINAIAPGSIATPLLDQSVEIQGVSNSFSSVMPRVGTAEEAASLVTFLLSDEASFITGAVYSVDGGWAC